MIAVNCGAIPDNLIESELFGYEGGSFTGAKKGGAIGKFELADKGTLFLDEVGELPLMAQTKLLRVLQERKIERIGGTKEIPVNIRIVAATNKNLREMVKNGAFREDLYYRLSVIPMEIPPLRAVSYTHLDVYKRQSGYCKRGCAVERPASESVYPTAIQSLCAEYRLGEL